MLKNMQGLTNFLLILFQVLLIFLPILIILEWTIQGWVMFYMAHLRSYSSPIHAFLYNMVQVPLHKFSLSAKCIGFIGSVIDITPFMAILLLFIRILKNYKIHNVFAIDNANSYRWVAYWCFLNGIVAKPISQALITIAATFDLSTHQFFVGISTLNFMAIFWGFAFLIVSHAMYIGVETQKI